MSSQLLKCTRNGCYKQFNPEENTESSCTYHPGKPIFHDLKKGWTCCNKIVYDWDQFEKIPKCQTGKHTAEKEELKGQDAYYKSNTISNAEKGLEKFKEEEPKIMSIDDYNKKIEEEKNKNDKKTEEKSTEKKIFISDKGFKKCLNKGCLKEYQNDDEECNYHDGIPVFHDVRKYWSCCKKETWDFDEFIKLPTCKVGKHTPKMV